MNFGSFAYSKGGIGESFAVTFYPMGAGIAAQLESKYEQFWAKLRISISPSTLPTCRGDRTL